MNENDSTFFKKGTLQNFDNKLQYSRYMNENDSTFFKKGMFQNFDNKLRKWRKNGKSLLHYNKMYFQ